MLKRPLSNSLVITLTLVLLTSIAAPAIASPGGIETAKNISSAYSQAPGPSSAAELEMFMDSLLKKEIVDNHIAGTAVSVVKDGKLVISSILSVATLMYCLLVWKGPYWRTIYRIYYTFITIAAVAFIWFLNQWNLLGWRY